MTYLKLTALCLSLLLLFSSCGIIIINRGGEEETTAEDLPIAPPASDSETYPVVTRPSDEEASRDRLSALPSADLGGISVFFAVASETGDVFQDDGGAYRAAVQKRNEMVRAKYNASVLVSRQSAEELRLLAEAAALSGSYFADFAVIRGGDLGGYLEEELLLNLKSLPYADYGADYYRRQAMEQLSAGGMIYGAVGDATEQPEHYTCLYVNAELAESLGASVDYRAVLRGEFTWDRFLISLMTLPEGTTGLVSAFDEETTASYAFAASGGTFVKANGEGKLRLACDTAESRDLIGFLKTLYALDDVSLGGEEEKPSGFDLFLEGDALYAVGTLADMERLAAAGFLWEALPMPKLSEELPYFTAMTGDTPVVTALSSCRNLDVMGYILDAVNAASGDYLVSEYYAHVLRRLVCSSRTLDMIDLIRGNPVFDAARLFGEGSDAVREGTSGALYEAVSGDKAFVFYLNKKEKALNKALDGLG